jgi:hypothetical protein
LVLSLPLTTIDNNRITDTTYETAIPLEAFTQRKSDRRPPRKEYVGIVDSDEEGTREREIKELFISPAAPLGSA